MSLEQKIEQLTAAVEILTSTLLQKAATQTTLPAEKPGVLGQTPSPNAISKSATDTSRPTSPESKQVSYDEVKQATIGLAKQSKDKALAVLARFGAKNAKELGESQWGEYVAYAARVASGEVDAEASA